MALANDDDIIIEYLLGQASEQECDAIEQRLADDDQFLESLTALEEELILLYLRDELSPARKDRFARIYLSSPEQSRKVEEMRIWMSAASMAAEAHVPLWRRFLPGGWHTAPALAFATCAAVALIAGVWVTSIRKSAAPPAPVTKEFLLSPGVTMGSSQGPVLRIPRDADWVRLQFKPPAGSLRAVLKTVDAERVVLGDGKVEEGQNGIAYVAVPASQLTGDDYILTIERATAGKYAVASNYYFRAVRE